MPETRPRASSRASHLHRPISGLDAVNFPAHTEGGPQRTDEYVIETDRGYISPEEEDDHQSPTPTVVGAAHKPTPVELTASEREKGLDVKLVTWTVGDKEDPKNYAQGRKWLITGPSRAPSHVQTSSPSLTLISAPQPPSPTPALLSLSEVRSPSWTCRTSQPNSTYRSTLFT